MKWKLFWQCLFSPKLFRSYGRGPLHGVYRTNNVELISNTFLSMTNLLLYVSLYTSPFIAVYVIKRGFSKGEIFALSRGLGGMTFILVAAIVGRTLGRMRNPIYRKFIRALTAPKYDMDIYMAGIRQFDFDYYAWPASYQVSMLVRYPRFEKLRRCFKSTVNNHMHSAQRVTIQILAYIMVHAFGIKIAYPGTLKAVYNVFWDSITQGRTDLIVVNGGRRAKVVTAEGNEIDTMFIDHTEKSPKGQILVICCEGNSGFYEVGIMAAPIKAGYSVLGWNHPGFGCSTGAPFPNQEHNAIDAVVQYAVLGLGFSANKIVVYGWSIGGYTASWAAVRHQLMGLILDATFDDLLPLAKNQMPKSWSALVMEVVRTYLDLNIANLVTQYNGPVQLIRRTQDEVICLEPENIATNRANNLLVKLICHRHPGLIEDGAKAQSTLQKFANLPESHRDAIEQDDNIDDGERIVLSVIETYTRDLKGNHCAPMPPGFFGDVMDDIIKKHE